MKVIFLDIDGVLNSQAWYTYRQDNVDLHDAVGRYPLYEIDPRAVEQLNRIIDETGAKVVVSSTWRHGRTIEELQGILQKCGFTGEIIAFTPSMRFTRETPDTVPRGCEIDYWLDHDGDFTRINWSKERQQEELDKAKVKNYIILDDDSDMLYNQREHFIKIPGSTGLTKELADKAIEILNKSIIDLYYEA